MMANLLSTWRYDFGWALVRAQRSSRVVDRNVPVLEMGGKGKRAEEVGYKREDNERGRKG